MGYTAYVTTFPVCGSVSERQVLRFDGGVVRACYDLRCAFVGGAAAFLTTGGFLAHKQLVSVPSVLHCWEEQGQVARKMDREAGTCADLLSSLLSKS